MPTGLRIGVNALYLIPGRVGGTEIYLWSLLKALALADKVNQYFIYINAETVGHTPALDSQLFRFMPTGVRAVRRPGRILWEQAVFPLHLKKHRIDVLLNPGYTAPIFFAGPSVTVFHDLQHKLHPEFFRWFDLPMWNLLLRLSAERSQALIAVSRTTAADLVRFYPATANRITVIHHGVDPEFYRICERRKLAGTEATPYLLSVSTLHPHKNIQRLMEAFALFHRVHPEFRLVIAGLRGFATQQLESHRRRLKLDQSVTFTGWIAREELYQLFERAAGYIAPSLTEGYGMPITEALAAGIPVACSALPVFREIAGDAAVQFDPYRVDEIREAMETVAFSTTFRLEAASSGPEQARKADWGAAAALTLRTIETAARKQATGLSSGQTSR